MSAAAEVKGPWFEVPVGTQKQRCRSCQRGIYWIVTNAGKRMPVDCTVEGGKAPWTSPKPADEPSTPGRGVSHFATCPQAAQWRTS